MSFSDKTVALWIIEIHFANWKENYMISQVKLEEQDHHFGSYIEIYFSLPVFVDIQMQKLLLWDLCWDICTWGWGNATKCSWKYKFQNTWAFLFSTPILLSFKKFKTLMSNWWWGKVLKQFQIISSEIRSKSCHELEMGQ